MLHRIGTKEEKGGGAVVAGVARIFVGGGGTRSTPPSLTSVVHMFDAVAGRWGSVSAPAVSRVIDGAQSEKNDFFLGEMTLILGEDFCKFCQPQIHWYDIHKCR